MVFSASGWHLTAYSSSVWKVVDSGVVPRGGLVSGCFGCFLRVSASSASCYPTPWRGGNVALLLVSGFVIFVILSIKGLSFSSTSVRPQSCRAKRSSSEKACSCFLCSFVLGAGGVGWEAEAAEAPVPAPAVLCCAFSREPAEDGRVETVFPGMSTSQVHSHFASGLKSCCAIGGWRLSRFRACPLLEVRVRREGGPFLLPALLPRRGGGGWGEHPHTRGLLPSQGSGHAAEALQVEGQQE